MPTFVWPDFKKIDEMIDETLLAEGITSFGKMPIGRIDNGLVKGRLVDPGWSPEQGEHIIVVTPREVKAYVYPNSDDFTGVQVFSQGYLSPQEMIDIVKTRIKMGGGCWTKIVSEATPEENVHEDDIFCVKCGRPMVIQGDGTSCHVKGPGCFDFDYDADMDHTPVAPE